MLATMSDWLTTSEVARLPRLVPSSFRCRAMEAPNVGLSIAGRNRTVRDCESFGERSTALKRGAGVLIAFFFCGFPKHANREKKDARNKERCK